VLRPLSLNIILQGKYGLIIGITARVMNTITTHISVIFSTTLTNSSFCYIFLDNHVG